MATLETLISLARHMVREELVRETKTLSWQGFASVIIPGITINRLCALSRLLLNRYTVNLLRALMRRECKYAKISYVMKAERTVSDHVFPPFYIAFHFHYLMPVAKLYSLSEYLDWIWIEAA